MIVAVGLFCGLVATTIRSEHADDINAGGKLGLSDDIKKILINQTQLVALASSFPLKWPESIEAMFLVFDVVASGGEMFINPACELSYLTPAESFYSRGAMMVVTPFVIIFLCCVVWLCIGAWKFNRAKSEMAAAMARVAPVPSNGASAHQTAAPLPPFAGESPATAALRKPWRDAYDDCILSIVMMLFILYPTLVKSLLKFFMCLPVGQSGLFLEIDMQERCYTGRHLAWSTALVLPASLLYTVGIPVGFMAALRYHRDYLYTFVEHEDEDEGYVERERRKQAWRMRHARVTTRFGILFQGYREERYWFESVIMARKAGIAIIAVFGYRFGASVQTYFATMFVFVCIIVHLEMKPFGTVQNDESRSGWQKLHHMETLGLSVAYGTMWTGLLFFEFDDDIGMSSLLVVMSVLLVGVNIGFVTWMGMAFIGGFISDFRQKKQNKKMRNLSLLNRRGRRARGGLGGRDRTGEAKLTEAPSRVSLVQNFIAGT